VSIVASNLIQTKLTMPRSVDALVERAQLCELLGEHPRKVSLVVAPAGFGKTTLVCQWLQELALPTAWFSLDEWDNDPVRFWSYLLSALQGLEPSFTKVALSALASSQPPKIEALLPDLINQLLVRTSPLMFVLDDYHLIDNSEIHQSLQRFIDHLPESVHLLITSRCELPLRLSRLRVSQQLTEIDEEQLRFSAEETGRFYVNSMALTLDEQTCETLHRRTEGWVAALQLAGLSLQRLEEKEPFLAEFGGDDRLIADYLTEEVLNHQSPELRRFLLLTAHLPRFNAELCNAVLGTSDSAALLAELEQSHMFLIPLDQRRRWYRYHHLFSSLLVQQCADEAEALSVHRRASVWYAEQESMEEALLHAFQAEDFVWAGELLDRFGMRLFHGGSVRTLRDWMQQLPEAVREASAQRLIIYAWALFASTDENVEPWLQKIEQLMQQEPESRPCTEPQLNLIRSFSAMHHGEVHRALALVESSIAQLPEDESHTHTAPGLILCVAYFVTGQLQKCEPFLEKTIALSLRQQSAISLIPLLAVQVRLLLRSGRVAQAEWQLRSSWQLLKERGWDQIADCAWLWLVGEESAFLQRRFELAEQRLQRAEQLIATESWQISRSVVKLRRGLLMLALGRRDEALMIQRDPDLLACGTMVLPFLSSVQQLRSQLAFELGEAREQDDLAELAQNIELASDASREQDLLLSARCLLQQGYAAEVVQLLTPFLAAAEQQLRQISAIEARILMALAHQRLGEMPLALQRLRLAVDEARKEGISQPFVVMGEPLVTLLRRLLSRGQELFIEDVLTLIGVEESQPEAEFLADNREESLSGKERKIVDLLALGLSNREISERLFVSQNTVKTHLKHIYSKLNVSRRAQAVLKVKALGVSVYEQ